MENLTVTVVSQILDSLDPTPVNPTREQKFLAFLVCKNLTDLCETGQAILHDIELRNLPLDNLPDYETISLCQRILKDFYSDSMFIEESEGNRPNWPEIESFIFSKAITAFRIYRAIRNNVIDKPGAVEIQNAVRNRDRKYFLENYDQIFANIPFRENLSKFKNFLTVDFVKQEHMEYVWEFFDSLLDIFVYEKDNLEDLRNM